MPLEQQKILVIDDAPDHQLIVAHTFRNHYSVSPALTLAEAETELQNKIFDLILLDVNLPDGDGFSFLMKMQAQGYAESTPVIFVTAAAETPKEVMGFSLGAEDYLVKPIEPSRLKARVEARLKKNKLQQMRDNLLQSGDLKLNLSYQRAILLKQGKETEMELTPLEFRLLAHFLRNEGKVFNREQILSSVWGNVTNVFDRTVDMHISNLRKKISASEFKISAVHGVGYRMTKAVGGDA